MNKKIPIEISARHIHLSQKDLEALFGKGYQINKLRELTQPKEFVAEETLDIQVNSRKISNVRIIGPVRKKTQVELAQTDIIFLGLDTMIRESGDIQGTPGAILIGPKKKIKLKEGVINTWRHIHCSLKEAEEFGLKDGDLVSVRTKGTSSTTFHNVKVRIGKNYRLCIHLDTDEGNAACTPKKGEGYLVEGGSNATIKNGKAVNTLR